MSDPAYVFMDTNTLLHFQRPDQVDWPKLLKSPSATLIFTPVVLRELDRQKVHNPKRKLRDRAGQCLGWLDEFIYQDGTPEIRKKTVLRCIRHEPSIDFATHQLARDLNDDILVAHAIELMQQEGLAPYIVTADRGLSFKLPPHHILHLKLDDSLRLPEEPDEIEKRLAKKESELDALKSRQPLLTLTFSNQSDTVEVSRPAAPNPVPKETMFSVSVSNADFQLYIKRYDKYAGEYVEWANQRRRLTAVELVLSNNGTAVATDIAVTLFLPDFIHAMPTRLLKKKPEAPKKPTGMLFNEPKNYSLDSLVKRGFVENPHAAHVDVERNTVTFRSGKLVQGRQVGYDRVYLLFNSPEDIRDFQIQYHFTLVEYPAPEEGSLAVTIATSP